MLVSGIFAFLLLANADLFSSAVHRACKITLGGSKPSKVGGFPPRYFNCSLEQNKIAAKITWKEKDKVLKQAAGPRKWLVLSTDKIAVKRVQDLRCEVMIRRQNQSCGISNQVPPRITSRKQVYEVYVGTSIVIPCRATGSPEPDISWIKRTDSLAKQVMPKAVKQIKSRGSLDLVIKKVSRMDSGIYTCHAINSLGNDNRLVFVSVLYIPLVLSPRVVSLKRVVTVQKGSTAVLVCSAKHTPERYTALFWNHQGTRVKNTKRRHTKSRYSVQIVKKKYKDERLDMSLTISHVTSKDVGLYTCGVVTHVGRDEDHVVLRIRE